MAGTTRGEEPENTRIILSLLESVERDGGQSQRRLASDLGIALGLVNAYLKRCVKKGLVKVSEAPARRYIYYLTPQGFSEKSRLTVEYLTLSFGFFRQAKSDCMSVLQGASALGFRHVALAGRSDLAEIAVICAMECAVKVVAIVDPTATELWFVGRALVASFDDVEEPFDAIMVTDLKSSDATYQAALKHVGADRVLVPRLLPIVPGRKATPKPA
jgi:DNA-binding MarR family transcriptional regulator